MRIAAKAIGTPKANAIPSRICGSANTRLAKGYRQAIASATKDSWIAKRLRNSAKPKADSASTALTASASFGVISPAASGRSRVRATWPSKFRSAQSFSAQPAERIRIVPITKMISSSVSGRPCAAIQTAHSVGHSSSRKPMGLSSRMRRS